MSEVTATPTNVGKSDQKFSIVVTEGEYNGKPTLTVGEGPTDRFAFTFGPAKARKLLAWIEQAGIEQVKIALQNLK
jgi:hypothetical protein